MSYHSAPVLRVVRGCVEHYYWKLTSFGAYLYMLFFLSQLMLTHLSPNFSYASGPHPIYHPTYHPIYHPIFPIHWGLLGNCEYFSIDNWVTKMGDGWCLNSLRSQEGHQLFVHHPFYHPFYHPFLIGINYNYHPFLIGTSPIYTYPITHFYILLSPIIYIYYHPF